jgi:hypothetical protein
MGQRKLETSYGKRPIILMLCLDSTLIMWLKVVLRTGKYTTDVASFLCCGVTALGWCRAHRLRLTRGVADKFQFLVDTL